MFLQAGKYELELDKPILMGVVNTTPDSFSDTTRHTVESAVAHALDLVAAGATIVDVGGESGVTNKPPVPAEEEIARVVPVIERLHAQRPDLAISVDTYKVEVADAAIAAGAVMVNDISGLADSRLAGLCARTGAALVIMHTRAKPKQKVLDYPYDDVVNDIDQFFDDRIELARTCGVNEAQLVLDPGPDFGKSPAQTVEALRGLGQFKRFGRPLLLAVSRKDFVGAVCQTPPDRRLAGTLAALAEGVDEGAKILRIHDVAAVADYLAVRDVLRGVHDIDAETTLPEDLRRL